MFFLGGGLRAAVGDRLPARPQDRARARGGVRRRSTRGTSHDRAPRCRRPTAPGSPGCASAAAATVRSCWPSSAEAADRATSRWTRAATRWRCRSPTASTRTAPTRTARSTCTARSAPAGCAPRPARPSASRSPRWTAWSLARSGFHHSMNYRCAVVIGAGAAGRVGGGAGPRPRPGRRPDRARPGRDPAGAHPQGAGRDRGARRTPARGVAQAARRRRRRRAGGRRGRDLGRRPAAADGRRRPRADPLTSAPVPGRRRPPGRRAARPAVSRVCGHVTHAGPAQARHRPPRAGGRDPVPVRGQGADHRRDGAPHHRRRPGRPALRRARREGLLPAAARLRDQRPARLAGPRGRRGDRGGPRAQRRHRRPQGRPRHHPRRPLALQPREPRARLGLARVRRPRDRDLVPQLWLPANLGSHPSLLSRRACRGMRPVVP